MFGSREEFDYFQCQNCQCLQITEIPSDLSRHYPSSYYSFNFQKFHEPAKPLIRKRLEMWCSRQMIFDRGHKQSRFARLFVTPPDSTKKIGPLLQACRVNSFQNSFLDVGCGSSSWWLSDLKSIGFSNLKGVDPFIDRDIEADGIEIKKMQLGEMSERFDIITLHHSLEHTPDQLSTLHQIREHLNPGGCCLIRIPVVSSDVWDQYGTDWVELDAPRHLFLHSMESIKLVAERAGLRLFHKSWDSTEFEFWGSEQYRRGIPLMSDDSFFIAPKRSSFTYREMASFREQAENANHKGRGGRGLFFFESVD